MKEETWSHVPPLRIDLSNRFCAYDVTQRGFTAYHHYSCDNGDPLHSGGLLAMRDSSAKQHNSAVLCAYFQDQNEGHCPSSKFPLPLFASSVASQVVAAPANVTAFWMQSRGSESFLRIIHYSICCALIYRVWNCHCYGKKKTVLFTLQRKNNTTGRFLAIMLFPFTKIFKLFKLIERLMLSFQRIP